MATYNIITFSRASRGRAKCGAVCFHFPVSPWKICSGRDWRAREREPEGAYDFATNPPRAQPPRWGDNGSIPAIHAPIRTAHGKPDKDSLGMSWARTDLPSAALSPIPHSSHYKPLTRLSFPSEIPPFPCPVPIRPSPAAVSRLSFPSSPAALALL